MTKPYLNQTIRDVRSVDMAPTLEDMEFMQCTFIACLLSTRKDPLQRAIVRNIILKDCHVTSSDISGAVIKDCTIDGLKARGLTIVYGCAYEHVALKGRIGRLWLRGLSYDLDPISRTPDWNTSQAFERANEALYRQMDWALDIREVVVQELQLDGIPGHLVRRDPERHVVFTRAKAVEGEWRKYDLRGTIVPIVLNNLATSSMESQVLVIPDIDPNREQLATAVRTLRQAGIAEPD